MPIAIAAREGGGDIMTQEQRTWEDPISTLDGVGVKTVERLAALGLYTIRDLLFHFPFRFEDIQARDLATLLEGEKVTLVGKVVTPPTVAYYGAKRSRLQFKLAVNSNEVIQVVFFNQAYLAKAITVGQEKAIFGKWDGDRQTLLAMKVIPLAKQGDDFDPVYHLTQGLKQSQVVKAMAAAFSQSVIIPDLLPQSLNDKYHLLPLRQALFQMHFPKDKAERQQAERKIIYQEFFLYQWRLQQASRQRHALKGKEIHYDVEDLKAYIQALPFDLTAAQKQAVNDICYDLLAPYPMHRMLQGDVGSGKTLVAFVAMIANVLAGYQTAMMVPTEILAGQHVASFNRLFESMGLHAERLVAVMGTKEKKEVVDGLASGRIRLVIGTHALIQSTVTFANLGLVIIDEQHRFGVGQRQALLEKGTGTDRVNLLQMTATPIPRTLALSLYGEMGVSTLDQSPAGRQPIETLFLKESDSEGAYDRMARELAKGHQVYYVLPIIEESEALTTIENVNSLYEKLKDRFPHQRIERLHGQMTKEEQKAAMEAFVAHEVDILIATTMVEVGVDVPNATVMVIHSAERFGLAQLHQLRGRVGRGHAQSYCFLIGDPTTDQGKRRMEIMVQSRDGFYISQEDMQIRGHGDFLGRNQSGLPQFHYANLIQDQAILDVARSDVLAILQNPYIIEETELARLNAQITQMTIEM